MNVISLEDLKPSPERVAKFQGADYGANNSFFVVASPPSGGVNKHRHPYEEVMVVLNGPVEISLDDDTQEVGSGCSVIIPAQTWHSFINKSKQNILMVTIHASSQVIQEDW